MTRWFIGPKTFVRVGHSMSNIASALCQRFHISLPVAPVKAGHLAAPLRGVALMGAYSGALHSGVFGSYPFPQSFAPWPQRAPGGGSRCRLRERTAAGGPGCKTGLHMCGPEFHAACIGCKTTARTERRPRLPS